MSYNVIMKYLMFGTTIIFMMCAFTYGGYYFHHQALGIILGAAFSLMYLLYGVSKND